MVQPVSWHRLKNSPWFWVALDAAAFLFGAFLGSWIATGSWWAIATLFATVLTLAFFAFIRYPE